MAKAPSKAAKKPATPKNKLSASASGPVLAVGFAWYAESDYPALRRLMKDIPETYAKWLQAAEQAVLTLEGKGATVVRVPLKPKLFSAWCKKSGLASDSAARQRYAATVVTENIVRGKDTTISQSDSKSSKKAPAKSPKKGEKA
jgi:hypothetical protein